jgi:hypothetical protein
MICQKVCPANRALIGWMQEGPTFDGEETALLLKGAAEDHLPRETLDKLKSLGMLEYLQVIGRNLKAVAVNRYRSSAGEP